jgi:hypothetical protein
VAKSSSRKKPRVSCYVSRPDPDCLPVYLCTRVRNFQSIIGFRNILIHGYAELDDSLVWNAIAR